MATTAVGNGSAPMTRMEALISELHLLKSGMAYMQGRLDVLLTEIGAELQHVRAESAPSAEMRPDRQDDTEPQEIAEIAEIPGGRAAAGLGEAGDAASSLETELPAPSADEPTLMQDVEEPATAHLQTLVIEGEEPDAQLATTETTVATHAETFEPSAPAAEPADIETADVVALAEPVTLAVLPAEPLAIETQAAETPAAVAALPAIVVALAERRTAPHKGRIVITRAARWAAAIALIVMAVAVAATGTGFAGHGELLTVKYVCALAIESCSTVLGIP